jgi:hypothetical protein
LHIKQQECERRRVVKDFCFPDGIELKLIKDSGEESFSVKDSINNIIANPVE